MVSFYDEIIIKINHEMIRIRSGNGNFSNSIICNIFSYADIHSPETWLGLWYPKAGSRLLQLEYGSRYAVQSSYDEPVGAR